MVDGEWMRDGEVDSCQVYCKDVLIMYGDLDLCDASRLREEVWLTKFWQENGVRSNSMML